ncbi:MAG: helix-turn-helix domain-containing protein [Actinomycetota bacterium]
MIDVAVLTESEAIRAAVDPVRAAVLAQLAEPGSASSVAGHLGISRQKANYHLKILEQHGLVEFVEERPRRGLTESVFRATAQSYALAPRALGSCAPEPRRLDRLSSGYLVALGARLVEEVGDLARRAAAVAKPLPTLSIDTEITFASPADRAAFADEVAALVAGLAARYHAEDAPNGRPHRLIVASHPIDTTTTDPEDPDDRPT